MDFGEIHTLIDKIRVLIYTRVSSEGQVDNYSIESQINFCVDHAIKKHNVKKDEILVLSEEAEQGDNPNRPMLNYIFFLLEKRIGKLVIFLHPNRLSRHLFLQQQVANKIWELGCDLDFVEFDLDKNNPESMFMFNIQGSVAQYNKAKILADTKRGRFTKVDNNKIPGINRVYGYTYDKEIDTLVENTVEREAYLLMVDMALERKSQSEIARIIAEKYPAPKTETWYQTTVSRILRSPIYKGTFYYGKTEIIQKQGKKIKVKKPIEQWKKITIPRYISDEKYNLLQEVIDSMITNKSNNGRPSQDYLLKGLARCGRCGYAATNGTTSKTQKKVLKYYSCIQKAKKAFTVGTGEANGVCRGRNWRVDKIDMLVWNQLVRLIKNPTDVLKKLVGNNSSTESLNEQKNKKKQLEKLLKEKQTSLNRYNELFANGFIRTIQELQEKAGVLNKELANIEKEIELTDKMISTLELDFEEVNYYGELLKKYQTMIDNEEISAKDKKKLAQLLIKKVVLLEDHIEVVLKIKGDQNKKHQNSADNINSRQSESGILYVSKKISFPNTYTKSDHHKWDYLIPRQDELHDMYYRELLTFEQIAAQRNINWWDIKNLFKNNKWVTISLSDRGKLKRAKNFDFIFQLHYQDKLSLSKIYSDYGYSPQYVRITLKEHGFKIRKN